MKRLSESLFVVVLASAMVAACSSSSPPKDGGAGTGGSTAGAGGSTAGTGGAAAGSGGAAAGSGGSAAGTGGAAAGSGGSTAGSGGAAAGSDGGVAGTDGGAAAGHDGGAAGSDGGAASTDGGAAGSDGGAAAGADGGASDVAAPLTAKATITATTGNTFAGTATFTNAAGIVTMVLTATAGCPAGAHPFHLHANAVCGADGQAAGAHWTPKGDTGLGMLTCLADGTGTAMFVTPSAGYWTIGGDAATDLTLHAVMVHGATDTTMRIGCGVPVKQ